MEKLSLTTTSLELVPPCADDVEAVFAACQDPRIQAWVPIPVPYAPGDARDFTTRVSDDGWGAGTDLVWTIRTGGSLAGVVGLHRIAHGGADIGYWMVAGFRGRGILTEACTAVLDFAFAPEPSGLGLAQVGWNAYAGNQGSARVAQKLGFRFEGVSRLGAALRGERRDDWCAGLLATDDRGVQPWPILD